MTMETLPPGPSEPRFVQGVAVLTMPRRGLRRMRDRYGDAFTVNVPLFGRAVVLASPAEARHAADPAQRQELDPWGRFTRMRRDYDDIVRPRAITRKVTHMTGARR